MQVPEVKITSFLQKTNKQTNKERKNITNFDPPLFLEF